MTTRLAMAVVLLLALLAQAWGLVSAWRDDPLQRLAVSGKKEEPVVGLPGGRQSLHPTPPAIAPDLNQGYLFNAERSLNGGGGKGSQARDAANVAIEKIHYSGSIITDSNPKALLSYAVGGPADSGAGGAPKQGFLRVAEGDTVNGYTVAEILPEKIVFSRDGQKITKLLFEKTKDRSQGSTPLSSREQSGQIPAPPPAAPAAQGPEPLPSPVPRKQPKPKLQLKPPPSDEELRQRPLRRRPEPPPT